LQQKLIIDGDQSSLFCKSIYKKEKKQFFFIKFYHGTIHFLKSLRYLRIYILHVLFKMKKKHISLEFCHFKLSFEIVFENNIKKFSGDFKTRKFLFKL